MNSALLKVYALLVYVIQGLWKIRTLSGAAGGLVGQGARLVGKSHRNKIIIYHLYHLQADVVEFL